MEVIRIAPYTYVGKHISNIVEISKNSSFATLELTEEVTTLDYYLMRLEPSPTQSLWVRVKRKVLDTNTGKEEILKPTKAKEIAYSRNRTVTNPSTYVDRPTIYVNDKANLVSTPTDDILMYNLDSFLVGKILNIKLGGIRSDTAVIKSTQLIITSGSRNIYHYVGMGKDTVFSLDTTNWYLDTDVTISASITNQDGITSKFSHVKLFTGKKFTLDTFNILPTLRLNLNYLRVAMGVGETLKSIVVKDRRGVAVKIYKSTNISLTVNDGYTFNNSYLLYINYIKDGREYVSQPVSIKTEQTYSNPTYDIRDYVLSPFSVYPSFNSVATAIPTTATVHIDELYGTYFNLVVSTGTKLFNFYTFNGINSSTNEFTTKDILIAPHITAVDYSTITKLTVLSLTSNRFVLMLESSTGRSIDIFEYDILRSTVSFVRNLFGEVVTSNSDKLLVLGENNIVYTSNVGTSTILHKVNYDNKNDKYNQTTKEFKNINDIDLLQYNNDEIVISIDKTYRYSLSTDSLSLINDKLILPPYKDIFRLSSGELILVSDTTISKLVNRTITTYGSNPTAMTQVIRTQDNHFYINDGLVEYRV